MRLTKITTRTGDNGTTGLADGTRLSKDSSRITAIGSVDELNSHLGILLTESMQEDLRRELFQIQNDLFDLGATLATPGAPFNAVKLARLDACIGHYNSELPPLREFILPGGSHAAAQCHVARTVARRAERDLFHLMQNESSPLEGLQYLNRLSDFLFVASRVLNSAANQSEQFWKPN